MNAARAPRVTLAVLSLLVALLAGAATLRAAIGGDGPTPGMQLSTSGSISLSNSKEGQAIFAMGNVGPGDSGAGEVTIANGGASPGALILASRDLSDDPGTYGGALSQRLELRLEDVSGGSPEQVYAGQIGAMPALELGTLAAGEARTYRFVVTMLDGGSPSSPFADDNLYQRGGTSLGYEWALTETEGGEPEPPELPAVPPAPPAAEPPPPPAVSPPPGRGLLGTPAADRLVGSSADDVIHGRGGADRIWGKGGRDLLSGGRGRDRLDGGAGADRLLGGPGRDTIVAAGGGADFVDCGSGRDSARVDKSDRVRRCERLTR